MNKKITRHLARNLKRNDEVCTLLNQCIKIVKSESNSNTVNEVFIDLFFQLDSVKI